jgi:hypothetical protein
MIDIREYVVKYIIQICNHAARRKYACFLYFSTLQTYALKSNSLQILLIFSRDLFLQQQCKGAPVKNAH